MWRNPIAVAIIVHAICVVLSIVILACTVGVAVDIIMRFMMTDCGAEGDRRGIIRRIKPGKDIQWADPDKMDCGVTVPKSVEHSIKAEEESSSAVDGLDVLRKLKKK